MLPSKENILKTNTGFKELVLSAFGSCIRHEHKRLYEAMPAHEIAEAQKKADEEAGTEPPADGYEGLLPDHDLRLWNWVLKQLKSNDIINPATPKEARPHHVEAVLAMFDDNEGDDIKYLPQEGESINFKRYVDMDLTKPILMNKIIDNEYLYGLAL